MAKSNSSQKVCVIGAGFMGFQIALHSAAHGCEVWVVDTAESMLAKAKQLSEKELAQRVTNQRISTTEKEQILNQLHFTLKLDDSKTADIVIEAIPESLPLKRELFAKLDQIYPSKTIFATNSSSLMISEIEDAVSPERQKQMVNTHFYPPVWQRPMVEIMKGSKTTPQIYQQVVEFAQSLGLAPITVQKESTGYVFNRLWRAIKKESLTIVDEGVASPEDIDRAWMIAFGLPMGPFANMYMVGLDVVLDIERVYHRKSGLSADAPPQFLIDMVAGNELGQKTGKGFYTYPNPAYKDPAWLKNQK